MNFFISTKHPMSKLLDRPARLQVDADSIPDDDKPIQTGTSFNIWFLKWSGGDSSSTKNYVNLKFRVNISKDSGTTKASKSAPICVFFARGCCYKGKNCEYKHRLPNVETDYVLPTQDCFGREKTSDYRDDMDGVGSFNRYNSTLYVSGLNLAKGSKIENILTKHFQEFGSIDKIRVLYDKGCAFISFNTEEEAQFAKVAMQSQKLDENEVLSIRWASEDPNPNAQRIQKRKLEERALETVKNLLHRVEATEKKRKVFALDIEVVEVEHESQLDQETDQLLLDSKSAIISLPILERLKQANLSLAPIPLCSSKPLESILGYGSDDDL